LLWKRKITAEGLIESKKLKLKKETSSWELGDSAFSKDKRKGEKTGCYREAYEKKRGGELAKIGEKV